MKTKRKPKSKTKPSGVVMKLLADPVYGPQLKASLSQPREPSAPTPASETSPDEVTYIPFTRAAWAKYRVDLNAMLDDPVHGPGMREGLAKAKALVVTSLHGAICPGCGRVKESGKSLCPACFRDFK